MSAVEKAVGSRPRVRCQILRGRLPRVVLTGDVDLVIAQRLQRTLAKLRERGPADVVVDATGVTFLGCTGLGFLAELSSYVTEHGCQLYLVASSRAVLRAAQLGGLYSAVTVLDSANPRASGFGVVPDRYEIARKDTG